jgi:hypothetical protein
MKTRLSRLRAGLIVGLIILAGIAAPAPANAYGPSPLYTPSGSCSRAYCTTYAKSVQTNSGRILATFENNNQPLNNAMTFPIFSSTNNGQSWARTSSVADTSPRRWGNWTNPNFLVLPQAIGSMPAGTILLAGISSPPDRSATAIEIYRSNDDGFTWSWVSEVASGGGQWGSANATPIWEPYMLVANGRLIVYYSDERDKAFHDQKIVHQSSVNGVNWGGVVNDVALADRGMRPGMPVVARMANGQYIMTYEMIGMASTPNNFKISGDPESWNAGSGGSTIDYGGNPWITALPNGRLAYNSGGSGDIRINTGNGTGAWTPVRTLLGPGYSRMLQYVRGTGRVLILAVDGFWTTTPNSVWYADVDLGYSAGAYFKLVNRKSGKALDVYQGNLADGTQLVQWADNGGANQQWHVADIGGGYRTLLNRNSGRALAIAGTSTAEGANAVQWLENGGQDEQWVFEPVGAYYKIRARHSGKVLSVTTGSTADGANLIQWTDNGGLDQQWSLVQVA